MTKPFIFLIISIIFVFSDAIADDNWLKLAEELIVEQKEIDLYTLTKGPFSENTKSQFKAQKMSSEEIGEMEKELVYTRDPSTTSHFLFTHFSNRKVDEKFSDITINNWQEKASNYISVLVNKAKELDLNFSSLKQSLEKVVFSKDGDFPIAILPIRVVHNKMKGESFWVIFAKWEYDTDSMSKMIHVRRWVVEEDSLEITGFDTCS